jgi:hypothetical protein
MAQPLEPAEGSPTAGCSTARLRGLVLTPTYDRAVRKLPGRWRIVEMELWDRDAIDLVGPAFIEFGRGTRGCFRFIAVEGELDCRHSERDNHARTEFSWDGNDEGDCAFGRGWAELESEGSVRGHIYFHAGDDSGFRAIAYTEDSGYAP